MKFKSCMKIKIIKRIWRHLIDNCSLFTFIETRRYRNKYPYKVLNQEYLSSRKKIHFIHRYITNNAGDKACGYYRYFLSKFSNYECIVHDINHVYFSKIAPNDIVIIGGGGLLNSLTEWNYTINKAVRFAGKSIIWSAGFNMKPKTKIGIQINWSKIDVLAIRDYKHNSKFRYVPCATCMIPELAYNYATHRKIGVVLHHQLEDMVPDEMKAFETISNAYSILEIIRFIGSSEIILTSSYHAAYWSILMKKKCVIFSLHSEKFQYMKYPPIQYSGNLPLDINQARIYPNALNDSRNLVLSYVKDITELINE